MGKTCPTNRVIMIGHWLKSGLTLCVYISDPTFCTLPSFPNDYLVDELHYGQCTRQLVNVVTSTDSACGDS